MQLNLFSPEPVFHISELFQAYYDARKNKRNTINALLFEKNMEHNIFQLYDEIISGSYIPQKSICFVVNKPVKREIFAADFRDRVVHHFIINKLNPFFEKQFIHDSYACRVGKGTHFGIKRVNSFIRKCSVNYKQDCYILKLDVKGFFMHINKDNLFAKLVSFIEEKYKLPDKDLLIALCNKTIYNDPTLNCIIKGKRSNWNNLPKDKSLFHSPKNCGLPIGNLTSQIFANFYMNPFDHFVKQIPGLKFYGRYVDDFVLIHPDRMFLKNLMPVIKSYLQSELSLQLHPRKIYLQNYKRGVKFLGTVIKPYRTYIAARTKGNFYDAIEIQNKIARDHKPTFTERDAFLSSMNSYLGIMKHYKSYKLRRVMLFNNISAWWWNYVYLSGNSSKFVLKQKLLR